VLDYAARRRRRSIRETENRIRVLGSTENQGSEELVRAWCDLGLHAELVPPAAAAEDVRSGDVFVARLDVLPTLDGVEPGLLALLLLERRGAHVVNPPRALLAAHDKLRTAKLLAAARLPHPRTTVLKEPADAAALRPPLVIKPRFGSWGRDVFRCDDAAAVAECVEAVRERSWFRRHGALVQELLPVGSRDLRVLVAGGRVVGAAEREAAEGEWRTNVSLGGTLRPAAVSVDAGELARTAAAVTGADFVGVDLVPTGDGTYAVLELNAAVDFDERYSLAGDDVYLAAADVLFRPFRRRASS
jgi:RimK family alpha-L-glutamate ligase